MKRSVAKSITTVQRKACAQSALAAEASGQAATNRPLQENDSFSLGTEIPSAP
jgi:hypothetical protein